MKLGGASRLVILLGVLAMLAACDPRALRFKHFRLGDLDLAQWWRLTADHDRVHLGQVRANKQAKPVRYLPLVAPAKTRPLFPQQQNCRLDAVPPELATT